MDCGFEKGFEAGCVGVLAVLVIAGVFGGEEEEKGAKLKHAEAFELCEYGRRASRKKLRKLFLVK